MFSIDQTDFPLPALMPMFSDLSIGSHFMFEGGLFVKTESMKAFLYATATNAAFTDALVRPVDIVIKVTPFTE